MSDPTASLDSDSVLHQCLAFSRDLAGNDKVFKFSFTSNNFNFSFSTMEERKPSTMEKVLKNKKLSPSTLRRNARRREEFLKKKAGYVTEKDATKQSDMDSNLKEPLEKQIPFLCDQCGENFRSQELLDKHISENHLSSVNCRECAYETKNEQSMKQHKQLEHKIDQIDGNSEIVKTGPAEHIWKTEEERKQYSDFIRTFVLTSTMGKSKMLCYKCNNHFSIWIEFKKHMMEIHDIEIFIDIK